MIVGQLVKQPFEEFPVTEDFADELETGEAIVGATLTAKNYATLADTTATVLVGTPAIDGSQVSQMIRAGAHGDSHLIEFKITTDATPPGKYEHEIEVMVAEN